MPPTNRERGAIRHFRSQSPVSLRSDRRALTMLLRLLERPAATAPLIRRYIPRPLLNGYQLSRLERFLTVDLEYESPLSGEGRDAYDIISRVAYTEADAPGELATVLGPVQLQGSRSSGETIDLDTTLDAGAPTPVWTLTFAANGETVTYNTADFSHNVTAAQAGDYTLTLGPESIYPYVTYFDANGNGLTGTISETRVTRMRSLTHLYLHNNGLTGSIPAELGNLTSLSFLYLNGNSLSGAIPAEIGNLTSLSFLYLYNNSLTGSIPAELGNLSSLTQLYLYNNGLTGSIPAELGNLTSLTHLVLQDNSLTGSIPAELGNLTSLTHLYLRNNSLTGSIPAELGNLSSLTQLYLYNNGLTGSIPAELGNLSSLTLLLLHNNSLTGSIPAELGNLTSLSFLYLNGNSLDGPESGALQGEALDDVRLQDNGWTETEVDDALWDLYQGALTRTATGGTINVAGSNAAPSGTLQAATSCPVDATTPGKEVAHELANDGCAEGFNTWDTVTITT